MELQGTVKKVFETQTFPSGFQKREMVLLTEEQYPQPISIEFFIALNAWNIDKRQWCPINLKIILTLILVLLAVPCQLSRSYNSFRSSRLEVIQ